MVLVMASIQNWTAPISGTTVRIQATQDGPISAGININPSAKATLDLAQILVARKATREYG